MNDKRIPNYSTAEVVSQPRRIIVTQDPITKEFKHEYAATDNLVQEPLSVVDEPYVPFESADTDEVEVSVPIRDSKNRLKRQRIGHSILLAATISVGYVGTNYAVTSFNTGKFPDVAEDITQIPADLGSAYRGIAEAFGAVRSVNEKIDEIKQIMPQNGDK